GNRQISLFLFLSHSRLLLLLLQFCSLLYSIPTFFASVSFSRFLHSYSHHQHSSNSFQSIPISLFHHIARVFFCCSRFHSFSLMLEMSTELSTFL
ncbi:hypothetical protein S83_025473, partial [Arachis hypogaea]